MASSLLSNTNQPVGIDGEHASTNSTQPLGLLSDLCRKCIVLNLERYPPDVFIILDEGEWDSLIKLRHEKSTPLKGNGGLDGTGRLHPAVGEKFLSEVEEQNPHLQGSKIADALIWKDIVEYRFKKGGLSRPKNLLAPWPVLVEQLEQVGKVLNSCLLQQHGNHEATLQAIKYLEESPMDLNLLKDSRIGKTVKKFLSKAEGHLDFLDEPYVFSRGKDIRKTPRSTLQATLNTWMEMAAKGGVKMKVEGDSSPTKAKAREPSSLSSKESSQANTLVDLSAAKKCSSWRALYQTLKAQNEQRRNQHGEKMRERRQKLDMVRPKIVKVRHASAKQDKILNHSSFGSGYNPNAKSPPRNSKIQQLKMEAQVTSTRRRPPTDISPTSSKPRSSFGAAVAFASVGKTVTGKRKAPPATKSITLAGGKRIKVPDIKKTASVNVQKRLGMLKKGQSSFRR
jgi:hypothetical protein